MRPYSSALLALSLVARAATAQTGSQPKLVLTIFGGVATGNSLWSVARQPYCLPVGSCTSSDPHDTLRLTRDLSSSLIAGAGATYFQSAHLGFTLEVYYLGLPLDDGCTGLFYNPDAQSRNEQLCNSITSSSPSTSAIALFGGVVLRAASTHAISPYVRGSAGVLRYSSGTVEMSGVFVSNNTISSRAVILDDKPKSGAVTVQAAAGLTAQLNPGYQFRLEIRDVLVPLEHVTGSADALGRAPTTTRVHHRIALTLGLDVVLEKKRGRRY
jgi:hypothetical protein